MTSPITRYSHKDKHVVEWTDSFLSITSKIKLLHVIFLEAKAWKAGLMIQLHGSQCDILWVDGSVIYQDVNSQYSDYLQDMYKIRGVVFTEEQHADTFYDILDKKLMWRTLGGKYI
jgi:prepilin-type processing-associated H-X9-DG protein